MTMTRMAAWRAKKEGEMGDLQREEGERERPRKALHQNLESSRFYVVSLEPRQPRLTAFFSSYVSRA